MREVSITSQSRPHRRRILRIAAIGLIVIGLAALSMVLIAPRVHQYSMAHKPLPGPALQETPSGVTAPSALPHQSDAPSRSTPAQPGPASPPTAPSAPPLAIPPGTVQQIYMPSSNKLMAIDAPVSAMPTGCTQVIDPPRDNRFRGVFQCTDYAKAGSTSKGTVVLAGHSSNYHAYNTVFDHLSCTVANCNATTVAEGCAVEQKTLPQREVYLRTDTSGEHWLIYRITSVYCPAKDTSTDIATKQQLWKPTPGRLLLVTCLEQAETVHSADNLIAVAEFVGVK